MSKFGWWLWATSSICLVPSGVSAVELPLAPTAGEQQEADWRVIAARCGTPAFEKSFFRQSSAAVAAGLVSPGRAPAQVEKSITALRRSSLVLVARTADCPERLSQLAALQRQRSALIPGRRAPTDRSH